MGFHLEGKRAVYCERMDSCGHIEHYANFPEAERALGQQSTSSTGVGTEGVGLSVGDGFVLGPDGGLALRIP